MKKLYYALTALTLAAAAQGAAMLTAAPESPLATVSSTESSNTFKDYVISAIPMYGETIDIEEYYTGLCMPQFYLSANLKVNKECPLPVTLTRDGVTVKTIPATGSVSASSNVVTFYFADGPLTTAGNYVIDVPDGFLLDGTTPVKGSTFTYRIGAAKEDVPFLDCISLADGMPVDTPLSITEWGGISRLVYKTTADISVNTSCATPIRLYAGARAVAAAEIAATDQYSAATEEKPYVSLPGDGTLVLCFGKSFTEPVDYRVTIPAGFFTSDGADVTAATLNYLFAPQTFSGVIASAYPAPGIVDLNFCEDGLYYISFVLNADVTVNKACTENIRLNIGTRVSPVAEIAADPASADAPHIEILDVDCPPGQTHLAMVFSKEPITEPGSYTLTVPAGFFLINGAECGASVLDYTIEAAFSYEFTPAAGSYVESLDEIFFDGPIDDTLAIDASKLTLGNGSQSYTLTASQETAFSVRLVPEESFPGTPGEWTLTIPSGAVSYNGTPYVKTIRASWVIKDESAETLPAPVITPNPDYEVTSTAVLKNITLRYPEGTHLKAGEEGTYVVTLSHGEEWPLLYEVSAINGATVTLTTVADLSGLTDGEYILSVGKGSLLINGYESPEYTCTYHFTAPTEDTPDYYFDPSNGAVVTEISEICLYLNGGTADIHYGGEKSLPTLSNGTESRVLGFVSRGEGVCLFFTTPLTEPGEWTLTIPAGSVYFDNVPYEETITATWIIPGATSGVDGVEADGTFTVFTLDGRVLLLNAGAEALSGLDSGLYIINGKKVLLRK